jgi:hypothetical protein
VTVREAIGGKSLGTALVLGGWATALGGLVAGQAMMSQLAAAVLWLALWLGTAGRSVASPASRPRG